MSIYTRTVASMHYSTMNDFLQTLASMHFSTMNGFLQRVASSRNSSLAYTQSLFSKNHNFVNNTILFVRIYHDINCY